MKALYVFFLIVPSAIYVYIQREDKAREIIVACGYTTTIPVFFSVGWLSYSTVCLLRSKLVTFCFATLMYNSIFSPVPEPTPEETATTRRRMSVPTGQDPDSVRRRKLVPPDH